MKKRSGPSPAILGKGAAHRDRTKYYRPAEHPNPLGGIYTCDRCDGLHEREFSLLCEDCEAEVEDTPLMECNYCSEIELPVEGGECRNCGVPQYF